MCPVTVIIIRRCPSVDKIPEGDNPVFGQNKIRHRGNSRIQKGDGKPFAGGFCGKDALHQRHGKHLLSLSKYVKKHFSAQPCISLFEKEKKGGSAVAEQKQMEMLSALMGEEGQDAAKMLLRMQRLQRLLGAPQDTALPPAPQEEADVFSRSRRENMISAAIPFLNREYQKELYLVVRLMELRRVMGSELLETRERQEEPLRLRQKKLLQAVEKYVSQQERGQVQLLLKMMDMKEILGQGE